MVAGGQAQSAHAQSYTDGTNGTGLTGTGDGTITFKGDDDSQVPSPEDPDTPVKPIEPDTPNPNDGDLKIVYVPNFNFGTHAKSVAGLTAYADQITVQDATTAENKTVAPFVTTKDMRTDRGKGWELTVTASTFKDKTSSHEIKGALVSLENAGYLGSTAAAPTVAGSSLSLEPGTAVKVASADASSTVADGNQGLGMYSLALGKSTAGDTTTTDGVKFTLPKNTAVNDATYSATFTWTITPVLPTP